MVLWAVAHQEVVCLNLSSGSELVVVRSEASVSLSGGASYTAASSCPGWRACLEDQRHTFSILEVGLEERNNSTSEMTSRTAFSSGLLRTM